MNREDRVNRYHCMPSHTVVCVGIVSNSIDHRYHCMPSHTVVYGQQQHRPPLSLQVFTHGRLCEYYQQQPPSSSLSLWSPRTVTEKLHYIVRTMSWVRHDDVAMLERKVSFVKRLEKDEQQQQQQKQQRETVKKRTITITTARLTKTNCCIDSDDVLCNRWFSGEVSGWSLTSSPRTSSEAEKMGMYYTQKTL